MMLEIRIHGRGGQGAQVGCQILAAAFFRTGREVQAFASYGGERRGAPVTAFLRVDERPIRLRCDIARADHVLILDPTLLADLRPDSLRPDGLVVVNSPAGPCLRAPFASRVASVNASAIADRAGLGPIVATAVLGGFAALTGLLALDELTGAVEAGSPAKKSANVAACVAGYLESAGMAPPSHDLVAR